jgi:CheY-like chemotaxis protein
MSDQSRLGGVRVLVVDDTRSVRDVVTDMLKHNGAEVTAVGTADEALDVLQRERPDVLLSDLSMRAKAGTG